MDHRPEDLARTLKERAYARRVAARERTEHARSGVAAGMDIDLLHLDDLGPGFRARVLAEGTAVHER